MATLVPGQIVFLECRQLRLYAEVIQILESRQLGWVRPMALVSPVGAQPLGVSLEGGIPSLNQPPTPDMLWPLAQLQAALDTEVIPLFAALACKPADEEAAHSSDRAGPHSITVNEFMRLLWADSQAQTSG